MFIRSIIAFIFAGICSPIKNKMLDGCELTKKALLVALEKKNGFVNKNLFNDSYFGKGETVRRQGFLFGDCFFLLVNDFLDILADFVLPNFLRKISPKLFYLTGEKYE
ncbi:MAG: hypothetical protein O3A40_04335 [Bacteroidetes bacterium]|nr:hypothetical protein [Bacteroidota bacterium]